MNEATSSSATPRTKATAKTTAKAAATKTTRTAAKSTAKTTTKKPTTKRISKPKTATKRTVGETPAPIINRTSPEQFGRVNVLDITPSAENGLYPARVELGEAFKVTAQVFIEGRTKAGATVSVRNTRGTEKGRFPMICTNPGLDRWEAMVKIGDHSDLKPWEDGYADVKKQLGEWHIVVEGWEDTYASWLHDAQIKVEVGDDAENALESGAQLLERWAGARDSKLTADDKKTLREAAKAVADKSLDATARLAAATTDAIASLHETNPLRDGLSASNPQRFRVERPKSSFAAWYQFFPRSEGAYFDADGKIVQGTLKTALSGLDLVELLFHVGAEDFDGRPRTRRCRGLRHRLPAAGLPDWRDQPQGPQQHADRRTARSGLPVRHRLRAGRPRHRRPAARHHGRFQGVLRLRAQAGHRSGARLRAAVLA